MKTVVLTEPNKMEITEREDITSIGDNEVVIAIKKIGICGTDTHAVAGNQPFFEYPRVLGHELSGIVDSMGTAVQNVKKGDKVTVIPYIHCGECISCRNGKTNCCTNMKVIGVHQDGGMAEYLKVPEENVFVVNDISLEDAATIEPLCIGAHAVHRANVKEGESVLVVGTGPIGLGVARIAKLKGAKTIVMDLSEDRLDFCKEWADCDEIVQAGEGSLERLLEVNNGELPTVVFDATGNKFSMENSFHFAAHGGQLVYVGLVKDTISFNDPDFHSKELSVKGSRNATKEDFEYVIDCMAKGLIKEGYVTKNIDFNDVPEFFAAGDFRTNKTVISL